MMFSYDADLLKYKHVFIEQQEKLLLKCTDEFLFLHVWAFLKHLTKFIVYMRPQGGSSR